MIKKPNKWKICENPNHFTDKIIFGSCVSCNAKDEQADLDSKQIQEEEFETDEGKAIKLGI